jgi:KDO2-lipid IV(A) lauroyltransferase
MTLKPKIRFRLEYFIFTAIIFSFKILPRSLSGTEAALFRVLSRLISNRHNGIVDKNLRIAFPEMTAPERGETRKKIYRFFSRMFVFNLNVLAKGNIEKVIPTVKINHPERLKEARAKGAILITAHFGNWELLPYILKNRLDLPIYSIARSMDNPYIEERVKTFRQYMGSKVIYKKGSLRRILELLDQGRTVGFLIDQNVIKKEGITVTFFKESIFATPILARIHLKKDVPVLPVFLCHEKNHLRMEILSPIPRSRPDGSPKTVRQLTQEYMAIIEGKIKEYPTQWFWFHNRWKNLKKAFPEEES